jgi:pimeloyl-ACP methyl ester carboxylesterase
MKKNIFFCALVMPVILCSFFCISSGYAQEKVKSGFIEAGSDNLYYEEAGEGETIVFVHDGLLHSVTWDYQFSFFSDKYHVVRYDRRGYGKSTDPEKQYSNVEDLNEVFKHLKIDQAHLIGMSAGGGLCVDFTLQYPEKVRSLVLVGAVVGGFPYTQHFLTRGGHFQPADYSSYEALAKYYFTKDPYTMYEKNTGAKEKGLKLINEFPHNLYREKSRLNTGRNRQAINSLNKINVPALIIVGEYDIPDCFAHAGAMKAGILNSRMVFFNDAGHHVPTEKPDELNTSILLFYNESDFLFMVDKEDVFTAVSKITEKFKRNKNDVRISENTINQLGYRYLLQGKIKEAVELFKLNILFYPDSWNVYDSLAEAYMTDGNKELAVKNYEKSLELNPENSNAVEMLKKLKKE